LIAPPAPRQAARMAAEGSRLRAVTGPKYTGKESNPAEYEATMVPMPARSYLKGH
jgi:hypothetical protein